MEFWNHYGLPFDASHSKILKFHFPRHIKSNCCLDLLILVGTMSSKSDCLCICIKKECMEAGTVTSKVHCTYTMLKYLYSWQLTIQLFIIQQFIYFGESDRKKRHGQIPTRRHAIVNSALLFLYRSTSSGTLHRISLKQDIHFTFDSKYVEICSKS